MEHEGPRLRGAQTPGLGGMRLKVGVMGGATGAVTRDLESAHQTERDTAAVRIMGGQPAPPFHGGRGGSRLLTPAGQGFEGRCIAVADACTFGVEPALEFRRIGKVKTVLELHYLHYNLEIRQNAINKLEVKYAKLPRRLPTVRPTFHLVQGTGQRIWKKKQ